MRINVRFCPKADVRKIEIALVSILLVYELFFLYRKDDKWVSIKAQKTGS